MSPEGGWDPDCLSALGEGTTLSWTPSCLPSGLASRQQRQTAVPSPTHPAGLAHLGSAHTEMDRWCGHPHLDASSCGDSAHPTRPFDSPEPPLPCLESARQRNQVFSQANPCHLGRALPPTKNLLFPGPWGLWGQDWAEVIWALAAWPGAPSPPPPLSPTSPSLGAAPHSPGFQG